MENASELLEKIKQATGWKQAEMAKQLGLKEGAQSYVSRWIKKGAKPDLENYQRIVELAVRLRIVDDGISELATNDGLKNLITPNRLGPLPHIESSAREDVPEKDMHGESEGRHEVATTDAATWGLPTSFLRNELQIAPGRTIIVQVRDDSMENALFDGERAIINLDRTDVSGPGIFALYLDHGKSLQFMHARPAAGSRGQRILCSYGNSVYGQPFEVPISDVKIVGRVAGKISKL